MMKKFYHLLFIVISIGSFQSVKAQIAYWQFATPSTAGTEVSIAPSYVSDGLTVTSLQRGAGWGVGAGLVRTFNSTRIGTALDTAEMVNQNMYFNFDVTVNANNKASLAYLTYKIRISGSGGAKLWYWKYSIDNGPFHKITDASAVDVATFPLGGEGGAMPNVDLSTTNALQNLPAGTIVHFRLYAGNATGSATTAIGRSTAATAADYSISIGGKVENLVQPPLVAWEFNSSNPAAVGNEVSSNATLNNTNLNTSTLVRGAGLNNTITYPKAFSGGANFATAALVADTAIAVTNNIFFGFNVNAKGGITVSLSKLKYKIRRSNGGAQFYYWKYSTDGVIFNKLVEPYQLLSADAGIPVHATPINLSAFPALQNVPNGTTIYFRLYVNGANTTTGSTSIGPSDEFGNYILAVEGTTAGVLPVTLTSFTGKNTGNSNTLTWQTASEKDNAHFDVLRLSDGKTSLLGTVEGSGTTSSIKKYTFVDKNPLSGTNYYQLRQVDHNGESVTFPEIVPVKVGLTKSDFITSFSNGNLIVSLLSDKAGSTKIILTDMIGKVVASSNETAQEGQNSFTIPANVKEGIYIVTIINSNKERVSKKVIK